MTTVYLLTAVDMGVFADSDMDDRMDEVLYGGAVFVNPLSARDSVLDSVREFARDYNKDEESVGGEGPLEEPTELAWEETTSSHPALGIALRTWRFYHGEAETVYLVREVPLW